MLIEHPDPKVRQALLQLEDALCEWERSTGNGAVLILRAAHKGCFEFERRSVNGKPVTSRFATDAQLFLAIFPDIPEEALGS
jgi:hypothetical protein